MDFEESARNYKDHPGVSMKKCQTLIGGTNAWLRDRGVQEPGAEMVRDMENFSGSPALSMMRGRHPAHRSSFSREFSVVPGRKSADFIESAGEPQIGPARQTSARISRATNVLIPAALSPRMGKVD